MPWTAEYIRICTYWKIWKWKWKYFWIYPDTAMPLGNKSGWPTLEEISLHWVSLPEENVAWYNVIKQPDVPDVSFLQLLYQTSFWFNLERYKLRWHLQHLVEHATECNCRQQFATVLWNWSTKKDTIKFPNHSSLTEWQAGYLHLFA